jgi:hypothetical protein
LLALGRGYGLISGGNFRIDFKGYGCHNFTINK